MGGGGMREWKVGWLDKQHSDSIYTKPRSSTTSCTKLARCLEAGRKYMCVGQWRGGRAHTVGFGPVACDEIYARA